MENKIKVSTMSGKLKGLKAISVSPLDNPFCAMRAAQKGSVCEKCYSRRMISTYRKCCRDAWKKNGELLSLPEIPDFFLPRFEADELVRFNAHGEIIGAAHIRNLFQICFLSPGARFALWTKRPALVQRAIKKYGKPDNLTLIYSSPKIGQKARRPQGFDKTFTVYQGRPDCGEKSQYLCDGETCASCMVCYSKNDITDIREVLR